jgi:hypothetical protein
LFEIKENIGTFSRNFEPGERAILRCDVTPPNLRGTLSITHQETTMFNRPLTIAIAAFCLSLPAQADDQTPDSAGGRYTLSKVADGFLRLDTQTGAVALCSQRAVGWACQSAPEDRSAYEDEISRLRTENAALKQALLSRGLPLPSATNPDQSGRHENDITIRLPSNAEIDRAVSYVGQIWQRFVDAVSRAQKQMLNKG